MHRWTIDLTRGTGYLKALDGEGNSEEPVYGPCLYQYDLHTGKCAEHDLGDGTQGAEPVFVAAINAKTEDEGWVLSLVHSETTGKSRLIIVDGQNFAAPPVATIELPYPVPY